MAEFRLNKEAWKKFIDDEADYSVDAGERPISEFTDSLTCPECGSTDVVVWDMPALSAIEGKNMDNVACICGWKGKGHELVAN